MKFSANSFHSSVKFEKMKLKNLSTHIETFSLGIYQFFGLFPLPIFVKKQKFRIAEVYLKAVSIFWLLFITISTFIAIQHDDEIFNITVVGKANDILKYCTFALAFACDIMESLCKYKRFKKFYIKKAKLLESFKNLNITSLSHSKRMRVVYAKNFIIMFILNLGVEILMIFGINQPQWFSFWILNLTPLIACRFRHLQYVYYIFIIRSFVCTIKDEIRRIGLYTQQNFSTHHVKHMTKRLQKLKDAYGILYEMTEIFNDLFTFSLAANIIQDFVHSGCDYYWSYEIYTQQGFLKDISNFSMYVSATIPMIFILLILLEANKLAAETKDFPVLMYEIRRNKRDLEFHKMIHSFSLDMMQEKIYLHTSIFDINLPLFISIISGLFSYLVSVSMSF
jgi:hypothetical protein